MDRTERFYKIELLLRSRGCVSFDALLDELAADFRANGHDLKKLIRRIATMRVCGALAAALACASPGEALKALHLAIATGIAAS